MWERAPPDDAVASCTADFIFPIAARVSETKSLRKASAADERIPLLARARPGQSVAGAGQRHEKGEGEEEEGAERTAVAGAPRRPACTWRGSSPPP